MRLTIFTLENWREIGATLSRNKTRTLLTAFGIFWGTAMLAMLWGGAHGLEGLMMRNFSGFTTNMAAVIPGSRSIPYKGFQKGSSYSMTMSDVELIRRTAPAIDHSSAITATSATAVYGTKTTQGQVIGIEPDYPNIMTPVIDAGRFINEADERDSRKVVVVGRNRASALFGNDEPVGKYISLGGVYFRVIGVAAQLSEASIAGKIDDSFIIPASTLRLTYNLGDKIHFFVFSAPQGHSPMENKETIVKVLSNAHALAPADESAVWFMDVSEQFAQVDGLFLGIGILALFVGLGSLMAGVIGVGNIMWIIVKERTHEFGVRRAIGAKPADITVQVLSESVLLTLVAGIAGVAFATIVLGLADMLTADPILGKAGFEISFATAVAIVVAFFILGSAAGTLPAVKAMKIKPIEAIRDK